MRSNTLRVRSTEEMSPAVSEPSASLTVSLKSSSATERPRVSQAIRHSRYSP